MVLKPQLRLESICEPFGAVVSHPGTQTEGRWMGWYRILLAWYISGKRENELRV